MSDVNIVEPLSYTFECKINAPLDRVFASVVDGVTINQYFTDDTTGPLETGPTLDWIFGDIRVDIAVEEVIENQLLVCNWPACNGVGYRVQFTFAFKSASDSATIISIRESGWTHDMAGIESAMEQCSGWTHFFASLKAYLEHSAPIKDFYPSHE